MINKYLKNNLTEKQKRGLAILQEDPELFAELLNELGVDIEVEQEPMSPAQRLLKEDLTLDLMEQGFSRKAAEALSVF